MGRWAVSFKARVVCVCAEGYKTSAEGPGEQQETGQTEASKLDFYSRQRVGLSDILLDIFG